MNLLMGNLKRKILWDQYWKYYSNSYFNAKSFETAETLIYVINVIYMIDSPRCVSPRISLLKVVREDTHHGSTKLSISNIGERQRFP